MSKPDALSHQFGGDHYKGMGIEPAQYMHANNIPFLEGNAIKYLTRHSVKNGAVDVKKAIHFAVMVLEMTYGIETKFEFIEKEEEEILCRQTVPIPATAKTKVLRHYPQAHAVENTEGGGWDDYWSIWDGETDSIGNPSESKEISVSSPISSQCMTEEEAWKSALGRIIADQSKGKA